MKSKIMSLVEAVSEIPNGAEIAIGGFAITRSPIAFTNELIRQGKKNLKVYAIIACMGIDMMVGAGLVKQLTYGGGSLDRFGRLERTNEAFEKGLIDAREYSGLSLAFRFLAGSLGIPFIPTKTLFGTDMLKGLLEKKDDGVAMGTSPFDDEKWIFLKALQPENVVIHAQYADEKGNIIIEGPVWDLEMCKSAKRLYVTVDKIVPNEYIKRYPEKVVIPSIYTHAVIEVPYGAYPTSVYKLYDYDAELITKYAQVNKNQKDFDEFIEEYVLKTSNHYEFIEKCGGIEKVSKIEADPIYGYSKVWGDENGK